MTVIEKVRTARKPHLCENCHGVPAVLTIFPGHRYVLHTAFPDGYIDTSDGPWSMNECVACYVERNYDAVTIDACGTFCCGDVPCALPFKHAGEHSCRRCGGNS